MNIKFDVINTGWYEYVLFPPDKRFLDGELYKMPPPSSGNGKYYKTLLIIKIFYLNLYYDSICNINILCLVYTQFLKHFSV